MFANHAQLIWQVASNAQTEQCARCAMTRIIGNQKKTSVNVNPDSSNN